MSLLASFLGPRATRVAVVLVVALHALVLWGFTQYSRKGHTVLAAHTSQNTYEPITVVFVAAPLPPVQHTVSTPAPASTPPTVTPPAPVRAPLLRIQPVAQAAVPSAPVAPAVATQVSPVGATAANTDVADVVVGPAPQAPVPPISLPDTRSERLPIQAGKPDYAYNPQPDYPILLREQGVGGVVWLRVWVGSDGHPGEIKLAKGSGYRLLDDAALRAVRQWRFVPAKKGEQTLASWVEFPIRFTLNG